MTSKQEGGGRVFPGRLWIHMYTAGWKQSSSRICSVDESYSPVVCSLWPCTF